MTQDRAACIFGNEVAAKDYAAACRKRAGFVRRFGDDTALPYPLAARQAPVIGEALGVRQLVAAGAAEAEAGAAEAEAGAAEAGATAAGREGREAGEDTTPPLAFAENPVVIGTIRMGFGHYRIAMAMASAARALGCTPYWFDLMGFPNTTCSKIVSAQNDLYSLGSRLSQRSRLFNAAVWEPMNYEGFRRLSYNAADQKVAELMVRPFAALPADVPFIGCHAWCAQAAVHAGLAHVVNAIPDNWPMALHLAQGATHTVQTHSAFAGYKALRGMQQGKVLHPMPEGSLVYAGHYVDHELVANLGKDCALRVQRRAAGRPVRLLVTVGGAGAQQHLLGEVLAHAVELVAAGKAALWVNVGDHKDVWQRLVAQVPALAEATLHFDDFAEVNAFAQAARGEQTGEDGCAGVGGLGNVRENSSANICPDGIHAFAADDIFSAVYSTNVLMRACDFLVTKPSELAFYPVPKLMIRRVGGHEQWGAVRAAEVGDGTYELQTVPEICAFMDLACEGDELLRAMCTNIRTAAAAGIYNGAYEAVRLACTR